MKSKTEDVEDLEKFHAWLLDYLRKCSHTDLVVKRLRDHVSTLCDYEKGFSQRLEGTRVVQFKPEPQLKLVHERVTK